MREGLGALGICGLDGFSCFGFEEFTRLGEFWALFLECRGFRGFSVGGF